MKIQPTQKAKRYKTTNPADFHQTGFVQSLPEVYSQYDQVLFLSPWVLSCSCSQAYSQVLSFSFPFPRSFRSRKIRWYTVSAAVSASAIAVVVAYCIHFRRYQFIGASTTARPVVYPSLAFLFMLKHFSTSLKTSSTFCKPLTRWRSFLLL